MVEASLERGRLCGYVNSFQHFSQIRVVVCSSHVCVYNVVSVESFFILQARQLGSSSVFVLFCFFAGQNVVSHFATEVIFPCTFCVSFWCCFFLPVGDICGAFVRWYHSRLTLARACRRLPSAVQYTTGYIVIDTGSPEAGRRQRGRNVEMLTVLPRKCANSGNGST